PGDAHALTDALSSSEIGRIVACYHGSPAADGTTWIERKSRLSTAVGIQATAAEQKQASSSSVEAAREARFSIAP
ncbi:MAG: hypothetical protein WBZ27_14385, partial [Pseudolabrys sp.]